MRPVIGVVCDVKESAGHRIHAITEKYLYAVAEGADALTLMIPARLSDTDGRFAPTPIDFAELFAVLDGVFLPGSPSNVDPSHYGGEPADPSLPADPDRDRVSLELIRASIAAGVPLFGVCRGYQEMNVALGGTLHQKVHEQPGYADHREDKAAPLDVQYAPVHEVSLTPGGLFAGLAGTTTWRVNSLHGQGIARLAPDLAVEATAPEGLVEGFRVPHSRAFAIGVQWHPEWRFWEDRLSKGLFTAFGDAARARHAGRRTLAA